MGMSSQTQGMQETEASQLTESKEGDFSGGENGSSQNSRVESTAYPDRGLELGCSSQA